MTDPTHYCEGAARVETGAGFFRPDSRPARDLGVLLARSLAARGPLRVLDVMAGCGIRSLRYGLEGGAAAVWANDADPERLALMKRNLQGLPQEVSSRVSCQPARELLATCHRLRRRFDLVDLDGFGCPVEVLAPALEAVAFEGVLYLASTDGRSPTGHDRTAAIRRFGAAARAHPASWEIALRLQLGLVARAAWAMGRGVSPLLSFSEGRTFRTAVRLDRVPAAGEEMRLGMVAHCHGCGDQQVQSLLRLSRWAVCGCGVPPLPATPLAVSGPIWIGPLQHAPTLAEMARQATRVPGTPGQAGLRLLEKLRSDPGGTPRCWPVALIARRIGQGPPPLGALVEALQKTGFPTTASAVMAGQLRSEAPWPLILTTAARLAATTAAR